MVTTRETGLPPSSNGASSMHANWQVSGLVKSARVIIEVTVPPPAGSPLYFYALQATFVSTAGVVQGGAHLGLQWNKNYPGNTAVNFGGYTSKGDELDGSRSLLPSATGNVNTRNFPWKPRRRYELAIKPAGTDRWIGVVTDLATQKATTVRTLYVGGTRLQSMVVWSEVFAACDAPSASVRWSGLEAGGTAVDFVKTHYQTYGDGGCTNTNQAIDSTGLVQTTKAKRVNATDKILRLPKPALVKAGR